MAIRLGTCRAARAVMLALALTGCSDAGLDVDEGRGGGHRNFEALELVLAGTDDLVAEWSKEDGWLDSSGEPLATLPSSVRVGDALRPLQAGGEAAHLDVRFISDGPFDIAPVEGLGDLDPADLAGSNPCKEFSARYYPLDDETRLIAWPNIAHPDVPDGPGLYAERTDGEVVQIFHCDRIDIFPEQAGTLELEILLWHVNHADQATDPLAVEVQAPAP